MLIQMKCENYWLQRLVMVMLGSAYNFYIYDEREKLLI